MNSMTNINENVSYWDPTSAVTGNVHYFHLAVTGRIIDFYILILQRNANGTSLKKES